MTTTGSDVRITILSGDAYHRTADESAVEAKNQLDAWSVKQGVTIGNVSLLETQTTGTIAGFDLTGKDITASTFGASVTLV